MKQRRIPRRKGPNVYLSGLLTHAKWLRQCAKEIADAGHAGWGNTCLQAADAIEVAVRECSDNGGEQ